MFDAFSFFSCPVELISVAVGVSERELWWVAPSQGPITAHARALKQWKDAFKVISHLSSLALFTYSQRILLPQTASCRALWPVDERNHVENNAETCDK